MLSLVGDGTFMQVSGFTINEGGVSDTATSGFISVDAAAGAPWRVCSNNFTITGSGMVVWNTDGSSGCIDNNTVVSSGGNNWMNLWGSTNAWNYGTTYGTTNSLYIEHNVITGPFSDGVFDCYNGAKHVFRYNTGTNVYLFGDHGCDSGGWRSPHSWEYYGNTLRIVGGSGTIDHFIGERGGTGLVFSNTFIGSAVNFAIKLQSYRYGASGSYCASALGNCPPWGSMTGNNPWDGNELSDGYPGLDQIGMTGPTTYYADHTVQVHSPVYQWANTFNGTATYGFIACGTGGGVTLNRDYYSDVAPAGYTPLVDPHPLAGGVRVPNSNPPSIMVQPTDATVTAGASAQFNVGATGGGTLAYQWSWYGTNVAGATSSAWTTPATALGNSNSVVYVSVQNPYGIVTSSNAHLKVTNGVAPTITTQPMSRTNAVGDSTTFSVTAAGTAPLAYQWRFNSVGVAGATAGSYTLAPVATNNAGSYTVVVTNNWGSVISAVAVLDVTVSTQAVHHYYVATNGNDSTGNGSIGSPWATVAHAASLMSSGSTLYVRGGNYSEMFHLSGPNGSDALNPTVIINYPGETPVFNDNNVAGGIVRLDGLSWFVLSGLTILSNNIGVIVGYAGSCSNVVLTNLTVYDIGQQGIQVEGNSHDILLVNNTVHDTGLWIYNGEGFYIGQGDSAGIMDNTHNVIVRSNLIYNTTDEGIEIKPGTYSCVVEGNTLHTCNKPQNTYGAGSGAIEIDQEGTYNYYSGNPNHLVRNNLVYDTVIGLRASNGGYYYNNIIYGCSTEGILIDNPDGDSWTRYIWNNTVATSSGIVFSAGTACILNNIGYSSGSYNLSTNASYFVNMAAHDYHLVAGSAPIGAGTNLFSVVATDFDGNARPTSGAFDNGAYQYTAAGGAASPPPPPTNLHLEGQ